MSDYGDYRKRLEIVFTRKCFPTSRIIKADRYEVRGEEVVFFQGDFIVNRESVYDVKEVKEPAALPLFAQ
jgi:hypothetical protein